MKTSPTTHQLDARDNSLNLVRLVLAFLVLVSHAYPITGVGGGPGWAGESVGGWAVIGFFAISGYLITGSRVRTTFAVFLGNRVARIFPAFLGCLVVVAFGFAPIAYLIERGTLDGILSTPNTPLNYVLANSGLRMGDYTVAQTLGGNPVAGAWNGSLWTLYFEFLCYLVVGVAASWAVMRRSPVGIAVLFGLSVLARALNERVVPWFGGNLDAQWLFKLLPYFLGGAIVYMLRDRIPLRWQVAVPAAAATWLIVWLAPFWGGQLAAPLVTVVLLWIGRTLPSPAWFQRNDISYGLYVYAFPTQQLATLLGADSFGVLGHIAVTLPPTVALATASWFWLERPVLRASRSARAGRLAPAEAPVATPANALAVR